MRLNINTLLFSLLLSGTGSTAAPVAAAKDTAITAEQIQQIAPKSVSCDNPPAKGECATADTAARNIAASFDKYKVSSRAEQAAVISLMAMESDEFRYNRNHFPAPGVKGKGSKLFFFPFFSLLMFWAPIFV